MILGVVVGRVVGLGVVSGWGRGFGSLVNGRGCSFWSGSGVGDWHGRGVVEVVSWWASWFLGLSVVMGLGGVVVFRVGVGGVVVLGVGMGSWF